MVMTALSKASTIRSHGLVLVGESITSLFGNSLVLFVCIVGPSEDYIDLFLIHDPFSGTERRLATYRALLDAQKAGKIKTVGVSN